MSRLSYRQLSMRIVKMPAVTSVHPKARYWRLRSRRYQNQWWVRQKFCVDAVNKAKKGKSSQEMKDGWWRLLSKSCIESKNKTTEHDPWRMTNLWAIWRTRGHLMKRFVTQNCGNKFTKQCWKSLEWFSIGMGYPGSHLQTKTCSISYTC